MADFIVPIQDSSDFLSFVRDQAMPNGNLSIRGVARCCGVEDTSLIRSGAFNAEKLATTLSQHGFQAAALAENGFPPQAVWLCIEYYAFDSRAKAPMAKQLARTFGSLGVMSALKELAAPIAPIAIALPPHKLAIEIAQSIREITDTLDDNPRLAQVLIDLAMNQVVEKALPASQLRGVVEIAHGMGFKTDDSSRVKLGKFVKSQGFVAQKESRICNGIMTPINCYPDTPELRSAIALFFN